MEDEKKEEKVKKAEPPKLRPEVSSTLIFTLAGVAVGLFALVSKTQTRFMIGLGIVILGAIILVARKIFKKDWKWFAANGIFAYVLTFYATWVIALNL